MWCQWPFHAPAKYGCSLSCCISTNPMWSMWQRPLTRTCVSRSLALSRTHTHIHLVGGRRTPTRRGGAMASAADARTQPCVLCGGAGRHAEGGVTAPWCGRGEGGGGEGEMSTINHQTRLDLTIKSLISHLFVERAQMVKSLVFRHYKLSPDNQVCCQVLYARRLGSEFESP